MNLKLLTFNAQRLTLKLKSGNSTMHLNDTIAAIAKHPVLQAAGRE